MKYSSVSLQSKQKGAVLAISLLLLVVLTFVAVTAMEGNSLSFKMSVNNVLHEEAFNNSESARISIGDDFEEFMYEASWDDVSLTTGLAVDPDGGQLALENGNDEDGYDNSSLQRDFSYSTNGITGDVYVLRGPTVLNKSGAGAAQYKGYGGTGIAAGAPGGMFKYFEFRSEGTKGEASSWTASDYKHVP